MTRALTGIEDVPRRILKSQFVTSSWGGSRKPPHAFTHGPPSRAGVRSARSRASENPGRHWPAQVGPVADRSSGSPAIRRPGRCYPAGLDSSGTDGSPAEPARHQFRRRGGGREAGAQHAVGVVPPAVPDPGGRHPTGMAVTGAQGGEGQATADRPRRIAEASGAAVAQLSEVVPAPAIRLPPRSQSTGVEAPG